MPYIYVERDETEPSNYSYFECKLCQEKMQGPSKLLEFKLLNHFKEKHQERVKEWENQREKYATEIAKFRKGLDEKYPLANHRLPIFVNSLSGKPIRKWKCDKCGGIMSPHNKNYHIGSAGRHCQPC